MISFALGRAAFSISAAAALLAGCGGSQPPIGAPGAMPQTSESTSIRAALHLDSSSASYKVLHRFSDTGRPFVGLINVNGTLYGTTFGKSVDKPIPYYGTVYSVSPSGVHKMLYRFKGKPDGALPQAILLNVNGTLYGTTYGGGAYGHGVVYSVTTTGVETVLYSFKGGSDGSSPIGGLIDVKGTLYGTTTEGGGPRCYAGDGCGTVYRISTSGSEKVLHRFTGPDGATPSHELVDVNGTLYGTTEGGGSGYSNNQGTVFTISASGKEDVLHTFGAPGDGQNPWASLIDVKGTLYGTTGSGGAHEGNGTVFSITTAGAEKVLYSFAGGSDGAAPESGLIYRSGAFYGTTVGGGGSGCGWTDYGGCGTAYSLSRTGSETVLYRFQGGLDGAQPLGSFVRVHGRLYNTTAFGGGTGCLGIGCGTVFVLSP